MAGRTANLKSGSSAAVPLVGLGTGSWALSEGTDPFTATFVVRKADAKKLLSGSLSAATLTIGKARFQNLYVLHEMPGPNPYLARVLVADRRWWWDKRTLRTGYNIRRKIGVKRLSQPDSMQDEVNKTIADDIAFAPYSLNNGKLWTPLEVLEDVMETVLKSEDDTQSNKPSLKYGKGVKSFLEKFPVENLIMAGTAKDGLSQLMSFFSGLGIHITADGNVRFYLLGGGGEDAMIEQAGMRKQNRGWIQPIDLRRVRPSKIRVQFVRECELRFDFDENASSTSNDPDGRWMRNVLAIPDFSLTVDGEQLSQGNWVPITSALTAWGAPPHLGVLTVRDIRMAFIPFNGLWDVVGMAGTDTQSADWGSRVGALQRHFRQTFQINQRWLGRIFQLKATRVGTFDVATGSRANASWYSDYSYLASRRSSISNWKSIGNKAYVINVANFAGGNFTGSERAAPGTVSVMDSDQGIVSMSFMVDKHRVTDRILPSQVEQLDAGTAAGSPVTSTAGDLGSDPRFNSLGWNMIRDGSKQPALTANYKAATILTALPALGGKRSRQFTVIEVDPKDVPEFKGQKDCLGPVLDVMIGPGYETARIAWTDDIADEMDQVFGVGNGNIPEDDLNEALNANTVNMDGTLIDTNTSGFGGSLNKIAAAAATRIWHSLADRQMGSMTGDLRTGIGPDGWLREVGYSIEPSGEMSIQLGLPAAVPQFRLEQYLDATTRRIVLHQANPGG